LGGDGQDRRPIVAGWLQSGDWKTARALASQHSLVVIDAEHGAISLDQLACCIEVMAGNGCLAIVRVPLDSDRRKSFARRCLDAGAVGILFPNVQSAAEAEEAVRNCYYPSSEGVSGTRGFGYGGCNEDGAKFAEYAAVANRRVCIGVQLENRAAFVPETLAAILAVPGLTFTQDGPYDHSGSHLVPGKTNDARVVAELAMYREGCRTARVVAGKHVVVPTEQNIQRAVKDGYGFVALGTDMLHVQHGAKSARCIFDAALQGIGLKSVPIA
jgi:2-keto-3-deoxy-L-rhamnonate aldolase RhmA